MDELFGRSPTKIDLRRGLIAEYLFAGNAQDSSGEQRHGIVKGAVLCEDRFGRSESAYYFDGKDDYIIVESPPDIQQDVVIRMVLL